MVIWEYSKNQHHEMLDCDIAFDGEVIGYEIDGVQTLTKL
jgi:hypothetical protein